MSIAPAPSFLPTGLTASTLTEEIHVWVLPTPEGRDVQADTWLDLLSTDEIARAGQFHFTHHAAAFAANRGRLRILLGHYLEQDAASIRFNYGPQGKPELRGSDIAFNLSHTDGAALVAFTAGRRVGVDIEQRRPMDDLIEVARLNFSPSEIRQIESHRDPVQTHDAFYRCWTRKEAFLKGLGDGLTRPLAAFSVSCGPRHPRLLDCQWDAQAPARWQLFDLPVDLGTYTAALACDDTLLSQNAVKTFNWAQV